MVRVLLFVLLSLFVLACSRSHKSFEAQHHYALSGTVTAVSPEHQTITVDAGAIPNFMEAMTMEYPVRSKSDLDGIHAGERITATVNVGDSGEYDLSNIRPDANATQKPAAR